MSRPQPNVLLSTVDSNYTQWEVLEGTSLYIILYDNKPFNLRQIYNTYNNNGYKYRKLSYVNEASANNQAKKLNKIFQTTLFSVKPIA